jgi:peptidoglycan/LPS O-acetylase OafA/YrhL
MLGGFTDWVPYNIALWSVGVEFIAGFVLFLLWKQEGHAVVVVCVFVPLLVFLNLFSVRGQASVSVEYSRDFLLTFGMMRGIAGLMIGYLLFRLRGQARASEVNITQGPEGSFGLAVVATAAEVLCVAAIYVLVRTFFRTRADFVLVGLCVLLIFLWVLRAGLISRLLDNPYCGFLGAISFAFYAIHIPAIRLIFGPWVSAHIHDFTGLGRNEKLLLLLAVTVPASVFVHIYFEPVSRRWLRKGVPKLLHGFARS